MRARAVTRHARPYVLKFTRRRARRACSPRPVGAYGRGRTGHCRISRHPAPATRLDERTGAFSALLPRTSSAPGHLNSSDHRGSGSSSSLRGGIRTGAFQRSPVHTMISLHNLRQFFLQHSIRVHCVLRRHHGLSASFTLSSFTTRALRALCAAAASRPPHLLHSVLVY
jgi:hypothetical protein